MRVYVLLAICVLYAHAATISVPQKKLDDLDNVDLDNVVSEPELIDQSNTIKDIDNNLRNALGIPVKVIEEPAKKVDENSNDYVPNNDDSFNLKRAPIDLENPGLPQRQEHETQNPEHYSDAQKAIFAIKQTIEDTQSVFTQGLKGISESFNNLFANSDQLSTIQQNIQNLRSSFNEQVSKLNNTIKSYINPNKVDDSDKEINAVETRLRALESNFKTGVNTLSEGVELLAIIKEEDDAAAKAEGDAAASTGNQNAQPSSSTQAPLNQNNNPVFQFLYNFQQGIMGSFSNLNNAVQGYFNQGQNPQMGQQNNQQQTQSSTPGQGGNFVGNLFQGIQLPFTGQQNQGQPAQQGQNQEKPPGAAADEPAQTGWRPPNIIQSLQNSWNNIVNPAQNQQQSDQPAQNPIAQAIHNIVNVFSGPNANQTPQNGAQPTPPAAGNSANTAEKPADQQQGVNVVPPSQDPIPVPQAQPDKPVQEPARQTGPIQQLVQNNPIIKGLQTVAQRISNPERPRDAVEETSDTKGHGGWGPGGDHAGDNSDGNRIKAVAQEQDNVEEDPVKSDKTTEKVADEISSEPAKTE